MKAKTIYSLLIVFVLFCCVVAQTYKEDTTYKQMTVTNNTASFSLPEEILANYTEYKSLEDLTQEETCSLESTFHLLNEERALGKLKRDNCIPNLKTFSLILEAGWFETAQYVIQNFYLNKLIDPSNTLYTFINKFESQTNKLKTLLSESSHDKIVPKYNFENSDNSVKMFITLPDASYVVEYLSVLCYKDLFRINAVFRSRNKLYKINDSKTLFDNAEGECEHNFNSFNGQVEITVFKKNILKLWTSLFK